MINKVKVVIFVLFLIAIFLTPQTVEAKTYKMLAVSLDKISTTENNLQKYITLKVPAQNIAGADIRLENESMLRVKITEIQPAKRGKRNGYIITKLVAYSIPSNDNKAIDVTDKNIELKIKKYSETDFKGLATTAATTVVSHVVGLPFLNQGVAALKGAVKPNEGQSRIKSAGVNLYQSTPFSYVQKGEDLNVDIGEKLTLSFKTDEPEDEPNYEYTQQE